MWRCVLFLKVSASRRRRYGGSMEAELFLCIFVRKRNFFLSIIQDGTLINAFSTCASREAWRNVILKYY